jgi:hypothetical protein
MEHLAAKIALEFKPKLSVSLQSVLRSSSGSLKSMWAAMENAAKLAITPASVAQEASAAIQDLPQPAIDAAMDNPEPQSSLATLLQEEVFAKLDRAVVTRRTIAAMPNSTSLPATDLDRFGQVARTIDSCF